MKKNFFRRLHKTISASMQKLHRIRKSIHVHYGFSTQKIHFCKKLRISRSKFCSRSSNTAIVICNHFCTNWYWQAQVLLASSRAAVRLLARPLSVLPDLQCCWIMHRTSSMLQWSSRASFLLSLLQLMVPDALPIRCSLRRTIFRRA